MITLYSLLSNCDAGNIAGLAVIILSIIQITPIKLDPLGAIGKMLNKHTESQLSALKTDIAGVKDDISQVEMRTARQWIIVFDDERQRGIAHTEDYCSQILEACDIYKKYCQDHPNFQNHKGQGALKRIEEANEAGTLTQGAKVI